jgi:hypothetical protein
MCGRKHKRGGHETKELEILSHMTYVMNNASQGSSDSSGECAGVSFMSSLAK